MGSGRESNDGRDPKDEQLDSVRADLDETYLTTQQGLRVDHTDDALTLGERGPTLLEDFHAREKITHFDHERIPERVVHARGAGAYGVFQPYSDWLREYTAASFLTDPERRTSVFVRFSTVAGSRGSADTVRDVRGFATKFYTEQGNYDLVGNNMPVFFIHDGIKFPDFVHAVKPEPDNEIPQAQSAHDTLWDFVSLQPETLHMIMWLMSDRALPRSYRMMQGFGVHTFRFVTAEGKATFVKFHWKPVLGTHSLVWDECQKVAGKDPDYNRRDLWDAIEAGQYPEWELGVQLVDQSREFDFDFDLLDATKIIPEEEVPVQPVGKMVLNRNPNNFFAETEQVAFHTANIVPGIDFTNDPLLQARNFSYLDTQLIRLGGPNFAQIPINRPVAEVMNNQRDGFSQMRIHRGRTSYSENSISSGCPVLAGVDNGAFTHYQEKVEGSKIRKRSESFKDYYSQATLFWNSMASWEREHIIAAFQFELGKVNHMPIREASVEQINHIDHELAVAVAQGIGVAPPGRPSSSNHGKASPALSQANSVRNTIATRTVAVLAADGVDGTELEQMVEQLRSRGAVPEVLAPRDGQVQTAGGTANVDRAITTVASVVYDAVMVPGGAQSSRTLMDDGYVVHFVTEAYKHHKVLAATGDGIALLQRSGVEEARHPNGSGISSEKGVITGTRTDGGLPEGLIEQFASALAEHRVWERQTDSVPA